MTRFEKVAVEIAKGVAVDRQTAIAMKGGEVYTPPQESDQPTYYAPPPLRAAPNDPSFKDLTGNKFGRLTVLGLAAAGLDGKKTRWACRCTCGKYSTHRPSALLAGNEDRCHGCHMIRTATDGIGGRCVSCGGFAKFMPYCGKCGKAKGRPYPAVMQADSKEAKHGTRP